MARRTARERLNKWFHSLPPRKEGAPYDDTLRISLIMFIVHSLSSPSYVTLDLVFSRYVRSMAIVAATTKEE